MARKLSELNYYEILRVPSEASADAIKVAFHAFARRYHPDRAAHDPARRQMLTRIYQRGTEAYRVLCHPKRRQLYDHGLSQGQLRFDPGLARGAAMTPVASPGAARARPFVRKAEQSMRRGNYQDARLHLQIALGRAPDDPTVTSLLAEVEARLGASMPPGERR